VTGDDVNFDNRLLDGGAIFFVGQKVNCLTITGVNVDFQDRLRGIWTTGFAIATINFRLLADSVICFTPSDETTGTELVFRSGDD